MLTRPLSGVLSRSLAVIILWVIVALNILRHSLTGELFCAPCLQDLRKKEDASGGEKHA